MKAPLVPVPAELAERVAQRFPNHRIVELYPEAVRLCEDKDGFHSHSGLKTADFSPAGFHWYTREPGGPCVICHGDGTLYD